MNNNVEIKDHIPYHEIGKENLIIIPFVITKIRKIIYLNVHLVIGKQYNTLLSYYEKKKLAYIYPACIHTPIHQNHRAQSSRKHLNCP